MKKPSFSSLYYILFMSIILSFCPAIMFSQDTTVEETSTENDKWNFLLEPYAMFPNISGTSAIATLPQVEVDANPGDILENLDMAAMIYFEAAHDSWAFSSDLLYMSLKHDVKRDIVVQSGELQAKQLAWELAAMRSVLPMLEAGVGLRLNSMKVGLDLVHDTNGGSVSVNKSATQTWVDPILLVRFKSSPNKKFIYQFRGDIGGFGVGSDFAWQVQAYAGYRFSKLFQLTGGYRVIGMDYDKGSGADRFMYDMDTFGPVIRFGFNF